MRPFDAVVRWDTRVFTGTGRHDDKFLDAFMLPAVHDLAKATRRKDFTSPRLPFEFHWSTYPRVRAALNFMSPSRLQIIPERSPIPQVKRYVRETCANNLSRAIMTSSTHFLELVPHGSPLQRRTLFRLRIILK